MAKRSGKISACNLNLRTKVENFIKENNEKNQEIFDTMNQDISKKKKPLRPRRSKSFHTKRKFVKFDEEENTEKTGRTKRGKTVYKKRTLKG